MTECTACPLHRDCRTVNIQPDGDGDIVFLGEAPGADEDLRGIPFIGESGKVLRSFVYELDIDRARIRFTNSVRCRPLNNKTPQLKSIKACLTHLVDEFIDRPPKIIVPLGNVALKSLRLAGLLTAQGSITKLHGKVLQEGDYFVLPMFHPAFLLRSPNLMSMYVQSMNKLEELVKKGYQPPAPVDYEFSDDIEELRAALSEAKKHPSVAYDIETSVLKPTFPRARILCFSLTWKERQAFGFWLTPENYDAALDLLHTELLENPGVRKIIQHAKFELMWSMAQGRTIVNMCDTMLKKWHIDETKKTHSLDRLAADFTDMGFYDQPIEDYKAAHSEADPDKVYKDETTGEERPGSYENIPMEILLPYNCMDTDAAFRVEAVLSQRLTEQQTKIHDEIQIPQCYPLAEMECRGVRIDWDYVNQLDRDLPLKSSAYEKKIMEFPEAKEVNEEKLKRKGQEINLKSTLDLQRLLFDKLGLPRLYYTDTGKPSTDKGVLQYLAQKHPIPNLILKKRKIDTLHSNFVRGLLNARCGDYVHTSYGMVHTDTGRLNSTDPNLNNTPRVEEDAKHDPDFVNIKNAFIPDAGCWLVQADYSQIEVRVMAMASGDAQLLEYFNKSLDVHRMIAARVNKCKPEEVTKSQRTKAKRTVFGICYGQGAKGLSEELGISLEEAQSFLNAFFREFPKVYKWMKATEEKAVTTGQVQSIFGRVRRLPDARNPNPKDFKRLEALRQAINAPIQSTASDMLALKMGQLWHWIRQEMHPMKSRFILTVYDSLVSSVPENELGIFIPAAKIMLEDWSEFKWVTLPVIADFEVGHRWGEMQSLSNEQITALENGAKITEVLSESRK